MSTVAGLTGKFCCKCGTDVSGSKRLKDSVGRYWCQPCSDADRQEKAAATETICGGCGEQFPASHLTKLGGGSFCNPCLKRRAREGAAKASNKHFLIGAAVAAVVIAGIVLYLVL